MLNEQQQDFYQRNNRIIEALAEQGYVAVPAQVLQISLRATNVGSAIEFSTARETLRDILQATAHPKFRN
jgi:hypothetical protein